MGAEEMGEEARAVGLFLSVISGKDGGVDEEERD